jgi:hypothetical protein
VTYRARLTRPRMFGLLGAKVITTADQPSAQAALIDLIALTTLATGKPRRWLDRIEVAPAWRLQGASSRPTKGTP